MNLYELSKDYRDAIDAYNDAITEEEQDVALARLKEIDEPFEEKMGNIYRAHRIYETDVQRFRAEEDRFKELRQFAERKDARLKEYAKACIEEAGLPKPTVKTPIGTVRIQANGGLPSSDVSCDPADLPKEYRIVIPMRYEPDLAALAKAWKEGKELPNGVSFHRGTHCRFA